MKCIARLVLVALPACAFGSKSYSELFGDAHDAGGVMNKLNGMVAAAQMKLGQAERHHSKIVKRVRKKAEGLFGDAATSYGTNLAQYSTALIEASKELHDVLEVAKKGLAEAEAKPSKPGDWKDPEVGERAKLSAQVSSADRTLKRSERRRERMVKEAEEKGEEDIEEQAQKLGMKIGDMTPVVDKAKQQMESLAEAPLKKEEAAAPPSKNAASKSQTLPALLESLKAAISKSQADTAAAEKRTNAFLGKAAKDVASKTEGIQKELAAAQTEEIAKVLGRTPEKPGSAKKAAAPAPKKAAAPAQKAPAAAATKSANSAAPKPAAAAPSAKTPTVALSKKEAPAASKAAAKEVPAPSKAAAKKVPEASKAAVAKKAKFF